jgi:segregation and condensation protein B
MMQELTKPSELVVEGDIKQLGKRIVEGLLFSSSEPVSLRKFKDILHSLHPFTMQDIKELIELLKEEYEEQRRAFQVEEIAQGYLLRTRAEYNAYIQQLIKQSRPERLSHAALEVLAIIAYKQPITRPQIDQIRGVDSSGIIHTLIDRQLIEPAGKLEVPGRPTLYTVTHRFLSHFGLKNCSDLPGLNPKSTTLFENEP